MDEIYMDYNATTPLRREAEEKFLEASASAYANASSIHTPGRRAKLYLDEAREKIAECLSCRSSEIVFTAGGSESNNQAMKGVAWAKRSGHIVTSSIEHPSVLNTCKFLEKHGFQVTYLPVDRSGRVSVESVMEAIRNDTILVSIMWANNETGVIQPVEEIASLTRSRGIPFHTNAVQAFGKVKVDLSRCPVSFLSISGHKFYGPKGAGVLYVRRGVLLESLVHGGGQERGRRSGTEDISAIAAMADAAAAAVGELDREAARLAKLRDRMEKGFLDKIEGVRLNGADGPRLPNTSNVTFAGAEGEAVLMALDEHGIAASSASACASGHSEPSHVLLAMGLSSIEAQSSMRFSLGRYSEDAHVDLLLEILPRAVDRIRALNP